MQTLKTGTGYYYDDGEKHEVQGFDIGNLQPQEHDIYQEGSYIKCATAGHEHASRIPAGKMLIKNEHGYSLVSY